MNLKSKIREIPDFPKQGILFYDISTLLKDPKALRVVMKQLNRHYKEIEIHKVAAIEARGFIFGAPLALKLNVGFIPVRKSGKLPADVHETSYSLEYGSNSLAVHRDAIHPGEKVLIVDDLLATGGTAAATVHLVERCGGIVAGIAFLVELNDLKGRDKLQGCEVLSLIQY
jgi:adenine phosphoribosyltransferase